MDDSLANTDHTSKSTSSDEDSKSDVGTVTLALCGSPILVNDIEKLLEFHKCESFSQAQLALREYVVHHGIHGEGGLPASDALRSKVWRILLGVPSYFDVDFYLSKSEEAHTFDGKIMDDVFRTFKGNEDFWKKVDNETMVRVLRAIAVDFGYVQGMNVLLAPFLYIMPELDSYYCFHTLVSDHLTSYCSKNLLGVHKGVQLVNKCLLHIDPDLHKHILSKIPDMTILSVRFLMTLMANVQPLSELLLLWDRIFALGVHNVVLVFCAHLINMRIAILQQNSAYKISSLIEHATLNAEMLIKMTLTILPRLPEELIEELLLHTTNDYSVSPPPTMASAAPV